jgi:hypothetical protein
MFKVSIKMYMPMGFDSTPFNLIHDFEEINSSENQIDLFGNPFTDVISYLDEIQLEVDQLVVDELFEKIALMK